MRLMHVTFGVASVLMLLTTVWMLAADHNRQWKNYQRQFRDVETWTNAARIDQQETADYDETHKSLQDKLQTIQQAALSDEGRQLFNKFVAEAKQKTNAEDDSQANDDRQAADLIAKDVETLAGYSDPNQRRDLRMDLYNRLRDFVARVKFREDQLTDNLKFRKAALDEANAKFSIAVGEGKSADELAPLQEQVDRIKKDVEALTVLRDEEKTHRVALDNIFKQITSEQDIAEKNLKEHEAKLGQLRKAFDLRRSTIGRSVLEMPVLDAFNSPLKIEPIWLPNLTLNNNFKDVARFDHCTTCHQAMDKTAPGTAVVPTYPQLTTVTTTLETPKEAPQPQKDSDGAEVPVNTQQVYGFRIADRGQLNPDAVTISAVFPRSSAASAGLMSGDVIVKVNDAKISGIDRAMENLLTNVDWGKPLTLTIQRGLPHPYSSHPRLDLYMTDGSPHPMGTFGCTICHQGQGSATAFEFASHTPSSPQQGEEWAREYGWFDNHHWIFPMFPKQFMEAGCLKCHHEVVDLEPSPRFLDPPAPTLVKGYEIVRNYGCFGCHEINGFDGPTKRVGPDLRTEPTYYAAAAQLKIDSNFAKLDDEVKGWVDTLIRHPENEDTRHRLREFLLTDAQAKTPMLSAASLKLESVLKDVETPGVFRKVGPSLRYVASKDSFQFLFSWIRNPRDFRPSTKMPRPFGLWDHLVPTEKLDENGKPVLDANGKPVLEPSKGLLEAQRFEPIEIRAIANYLLASSQPFEYLEPNAGGADAPSAERGKKEFGLRCIACHQHDDFPQAKATQGPNLSRIGAKLALSQNGAKWLYSWIKNPSHYHARTVMPVTLPPASNADGSTTDPVAIADITAYLMGSTENWKPENVPSETELTKDERDALYDLALLHLKDKFPLERAKEYLTDGIPATRASGLQGDEVLLVRDGDPEQGSPRQTARVLKYVGRRSITKYGCFGCHDIPGFEDAKPIGTALADWGRKDPARLAFEQIGEFITAHAWPQKGGQSAPGGGQISGTSGATPPALSAGNPAPENLSYAITDLGPTQGWLMEKLLGHEREGFLWQKLRAPRSFDFQKTENKGYNERLRMPQFNFSEDDIEAVMTFVLGLVSEPPATQYLANYSGNPREKAVIAGTKMVEQFNCTGCHQLDFERWDVSYKEGELGVWSKPQDYDFLLPHFTPQQIADSKKEDRSGRMHAQLYGRPMVNEKGEPATTEENEEGDPFDGGGVGVRFTLWRDMLLAGQPWLVGGKMPLVPENRVTAKFAGRGGDLGRWIYPTVVAEEQKLNPNAKADEAWGWLPPPLVGEGKKVQTKWLHDFLLEPFEIRPAVVLRMPKFNMSSPEASQLVNFFAARDDAPAPYEFDARTSSDYLSTEEAKHRNRLVDALKIVTDNNYCVKCHLVGDFRPAGSVRAMGPQIDRVNERLRPDYVLHWVGNPKRTLPYTGMPVNIPFDKPISQSLYPGDSLQQLNGVVDLLMNWDRFTKSQFTLKSWIKPSSAGAASPPAGTQ